MPNNVLIKRRVAALNVDALNRTAVCTQDIENGCVFKLEEYSDNAGEGMVWSAGQAAATDTGLWMAASPEVVTITDSLGVQYKGIQCDPRAFINSAGSMIDAIKLQIGDIIEMTVPNISGADTNEYLVPSATNFALEAASAAGTGFALQKVGTSMLHIGNLFIQGSHPTTYIYQVVNN